MKMWIVREHRGDSYRLFPSEEKPIQKEDKYWYQGGIRGIGVSGLFYPNITNSNMPYDSPMEVELKLIEK